MRWNQLATRVLLSSACGLAPASAMAQHHHGGGGARRPPTTAGGMAQAPPSNARWPAPSHSYQPQGFVHAQTGGFSGQQHHAAATPTYAQPSIGRPAAPTHAAHPQQSPAIHHPQGTTPNMFATRPSNGMFRPGANGVAGAVQPRPSRTNPFGHGQAHQGGVATNNRPGGGHPNTNPFGSGLNYQVARPAFAGPPTRRPATTTACSPTRTAPAAICPRPRGRTASRRRRSATRPTPAAGRSTTSSTTGPIIPR